MEEKYSRKAQIPRIWDEYGSPCEGGGKKRRRVIWDVRSSKYGLKLRGWKNEVVSVPLELVTEIVKLAKKLDKCSYIHKSLYGKDIKMAPKIREVCRNYKVDDDKCDVRKTGRGQSYACRKKQKLAV